MCLCGQVQEYLVRCCVTGVMILLPLGEPCAATNGTDGASAQKAVATSSKANKSQTKSKAKSKAATKVVTPIGKTDPGWGETPQQRSERMVRECKGRPNAGACEGFGGS
jgi:hypothetical protein